MVLRQLSDMPLTWDNVHSEEKRADRLPDGEHIPQADRLGALLPR